MEDLRSSTELAVKISLENIRKVDKTRRKDKSPSIVSALDVRNKSPRINLNKKFEEKKKLTDILSPRSKKSSVKQSNSKTKLNIRDSIANPKREILLPDISGGDNLLNSKLTTNNETIMKSIKKSSKSLTSSSSYQKYSKRLL